MKHLNAEQIYDAAALNKHFDHLNRCPECLKAVIEHKKLWGKVDETCVKKKTSPPLYAENN